MKENTYPDGTFWQDNSSYGTDEMYDFYRRIDGEWKPIGRYKNFIEAMSKTRRVPQREPFFLAT